MLRELSTWFYLDLNDDALIRDIVSGVYAGKPASHDIQNLFPISFLLSGLYRLLPAVPWFGLLLIGLQVLCGVVILVRSLSLAARSGRGANSKKKATALVVLTALVWGIMQVLLAPHFFFVQYSVTVGMMAACAAYLLVTGTRKKHFAFAVVLVGVAWLIRSEMLLLMLPMVVLALFLRYVREVRASRAENEEMPGIRDFVRYPFVTDHYRCYGITFVMIGLVLAAGWSLDRIGYASADWNDFVRFFDARTQVYDFTGVPEYAANADFYDSIGLDAESCLLLENYNFGLEEAIDADAMEQIAKYATSIQTPLSVRLSDAIGAYRYRLHHTGFPEDFTWPQTDAPWNLIAAVLYVAVILHSFMRVPRSAGRSVRICRAIWQPLLLFVCRSALWLYILAGGRDPVRITHPLYFVEIAVLIGTFLMQTSGARREVVQEKAAEEKESAEVSEKKGIDSLTVLRLAAFAAVLIIGIVYAGNACSLISSDVARREKDNAPYRALRKVCARDARSLYLFDVYSSVSETRGLFEETQAHRPDNLELLGGWVSKSPIWREKLDSYGFETPAEALLSDGVYFVCDADVSTQWLIDYYAARGKSVTMTEVDRAGAGKGEGRREFAIYSVSEEGAAP